MLGDIFHKDKDLSDKEPFWACWLMQCAIRDSKLLVIPLALAGTVFSVLDAEKQSLPRVKGGVKLITRPWGVSIGSTMKYFSRSRQSFVIECECEIVTAVVYTHLCCIHSVWDMEVPS